MAPLRWPQRTKLTWLCPSHSLTLQPTSSGLFPWQLAELTQNSRNLQSLLRTRHRTDTTSLLLRSIGKASHKGGPDSTGELTPPLDGRGLETTRKGCGYGEAINWASMLLPKADRSNLPFQPFPELLLAPVCSRMLGGEGAVNSLTQRSGGGARTPGGAPGSSLRGKEC